ncbi:hypothetical protein K438DRAFT_67399 [Mycena galopus ATCC 62051]|nr:hypothetical protein K438DRAFT_67399 [Mycena galopus ATCC 62051]
MQGDIRSEYREALDASHNGWPVVIQRVATGRAGRPRIDIDPDFLRWPYYQRSTASIHRFLGVCRNTVRSALLRMGSLPPSQIHFLPSQSRRIFLAVQTTVPVRQIQTTWTTFLILKSQFLTIFLPTSRT